MVVVSCCMEPPEDQPEIHPDLSYPYRRFSNDVFASQLVQLLEQHEIPFDIVSEPEGVGSVFLGSAAVPGIIVMVHPGDAHAIQQLEMQETPAVHAGKIPDENEEPVSATWLIMGYCFALVGAPIAIIAGIHLFSARRRKRDLTSRYAYDARTRQHGRLIFWFALSIFVFGLANLMTGAKMTFLDSMSFILWQFNNMRL